MNCTTITTLAVTAYAIGAGAGIIAGIGTALSILRIERRRARNDRLRLINEMMDLDGRDMYGLENEHLAAQADDADERHRRGDA